MITMDTTSVTHLSRRAGFGLTLSEYQAFRSQTTEQLFNRYWPEQITDLEEPDFFPQVRLKDLQDPERLVKLRQQARELTGRVAYDWFMRMALGPLETQLVERICLFWHGHFACRIEQPVLAVRYLNTLRRHGLGNFRDLVLNIARDGAMIRYLNNQQNRKDQPNENFARELMELFTMGRGNYSERDVKEAARAFTGWSTDLQGNYIFRTRQHDDGIKSFLGNTGHWNGEDIVDIILKQEVTAEFIANRIYRYFVHPTVDREVVSAMAQRLLATKYDLGDLFRNLFTSDHFYEPHNVGVRIKSPVEWLAGMSRALQTPIPPDQGLAGFFRLTGQVLFNPPNVAGWPGGRSWVDNASLQLRTNIPFLALNDTPNRNRKSRPWEVDWSQLTKNIPAGQNYPELLAAWLLVQSPGERTALIHFLRPLLHAKPEFPYWTVALLATPEYQMA